MQHISIYKDAFKIDIQTRYSDFDMVQHLNNTAYLNYIELARADAFTHVMKLDTKIHTGLAVNVSINYKRPIQYGMPVSILMRFIKVKGVSNLLHFEFVNSNDLSDVYAVAEMTQVLFVIKKQKPIPVSAYIKAYAENLQLNKESDFIADVSLIQRKIEDVA